MTKGLTGLTFLGKSELGLGRTRLETGRYFILAFISLFLSPVKYAEWVPVSASSMEHLASNSVLARTAIPEGALLQLLNWGRPKEVRAGRSTADPDFEKPK